eukprot:29325-Pleurochrysis_carterae.AAC.1
MQATRRSFARQVLTESREHIMGAGGAFSPAMWARWRQLTHTSNNAITALREMSCNTRPPAANSVAEDDDRGSSSSEDDGNKALQKRSRPIPNWMHPEFGIPFRPVATPWLINKEDSVLRQGERAQLAVSGKGATMSLSSSIMASVRRA